MSATARLELRIDPESKALIERAALLSRRSVAAFTKEVLVTRARQLVLGSESPSSQASRPIGGWSFEIPDGFSDPLDDMAPYS